MLDIAYRERKAKNYVNITPTTIHFTQSISMTSYERKNEKKKLRMEKHVLVSAGVGVYLYNFSETVFVQEKQETIFSMTSLMGKGKKESHNNNFFLNKI